MIKTDSGYYRLNYNAEHIFTPTDNADPSYYVREWQINLLELLDYDLTAPVGWFEIQVVNLEQARIEGGHHTFDVMDSFGGDTYDYYRALFTKTGELRAPVQKQIDFWFGTDLLIVHIGAIAKKHRGQKLGLKAVKEIVRTLGEGKLVLLTPQPIDHMTSLPKQLRESPLSIDDLRKYWKRLGLKRIKGTSVFAAPAIEILDAYV